MAEHKLRICKIQNMELPVGTQVKFRGQIVGKAINKGEIVIDNDTAYSLIRSDNVKFSLEVAHKYD